MEKLRGLKNINFGELVDQLGNKKMSILTMFGSVILFITTLVIWLFLQRIADVPLFAEFRFIFSIPNAILIPIMGYFVISFIGGLIIFGVE